MKQNTKLDKVMKQVLWIAPYSVIKDIHLFMIMCMSVCLSITLLTKNDQAK